MGRFLNFISKAPLWYSWVAANRICSITPSYGERTSTYPVNTQTTNTTRQVGTLPVQYFRYSAIPVTSLSQPLGVAGLFSRFLHLQHALSPPCHSLMLSTGTLCSTASHEFLEQNWERTGELGNCHPRATMMSNGPDSTYKCCSHLCKEEDSIVWEYCFAAEWVVVDESTQEHGRVIILSNISTNVHWSISTRQINAVVTIRLSFHDHLNS